MADEPSCSANMAAPRGEQLPPHDNANQSPEDGSGSASSEVLFKGRLNHKLPKPTPLGIPSSEMQLLRLRSPSPTESPPDYSSTLEAKLLAEKIFILVSPQDLLLRVQLVCKSWSSIIFTSPLLQQKLFLQAIPETRTTATLKVDLNLYSPDEEESTYAHFVQTSSLTADPIRVMRNPFMTPSLLKDLQAYEGYSSPNVPATVAYKALPRDRRRKLAVAEASYCYMLAFQPPVITATFLAKDMVFDEEEGWPEMLVVKKAEGVKIWDMVLRKELRRDFRREALEVKVASRGV